MLPSFWRMASFDLARLKVLASAMVLEVELSLFNSMSILYQFAPCLDGCSWCLIPDFPTEAHSYHFVSILIHDDRRLPNPAFQWRCAHLLWVSNPWMASAKDLHHVLSSVVATQQHWETCWNHTFAKTYGHHAGQPNFFTPATRSCSGRRKYIKGTQVQVEVAWPRFELNQWVSKFKAGGSTNNSWRLKNITHSAKPGKKVEEPMGKV